MFDRIVDDIVGYVLAHAGETEALWAVDGVLDLMYDASNHPESKRPGGIRPHSNGYGCWFVPDDEKLLTTKPLTAEEILVRVRQRMELATAPAGTEP